MSVKSVGRVFEIKILKNAEGEHNIVAGVVGGLRQMENYTHVTVIPKRGLNNERYREQSTKGG